MIPIPCVMEGSMKTQNFLFGECLWRKKLHSWEKEFISKDKMAFRSKRNLQGFRTWSLEKVLPPHKKKKKNSFGVAWLPEIENVEWGGDSGGKSELSLRVAEGGKKQVQASGRAERLLLIDEGVKGWWGWSWKSSTRVGGLWGPQGGQIGIIIV